MRSWCYSLASDSVRASGTTLTYHGDQLGSTRGLTNGSQTVTASRERDAWGNVVSASATLAGPFGFVGGQGCQEDADSGLMRLGARYYDPSVGRFISRDPIRYAGGLNLYGYCENDPVGAVDPDGGSPRWLDPGIFGNEYGIPDDPTDPTRRKPTPKDLPDGYPKPWPNGKVPLPPFKFEDFTLDTGFVFSSEGGVPDIYVNPKSTFGDGLWKGEFGGSVTVDSTTFGIEQWSVHLEFGYTGNPSVKTKWDLPGGTAGPNWTDWKLTFNVNYKF